MREALELRAEQLRSALREEMEAEVQVRVQEATKEHQKRLRAMQREDAAVEGELKSLLEQARAEKHAAEVRAPRRSNRGARTRAGAADTPAVPPPATSAMRAARETERADRLLAP